MKNLLSFLLFAACQFSYAQKHKLVQLWSTDAVVATPESVLPDLKDNRLYVSLIDGEPTVKRSFCWIVMNRKRIPRILDMIQLKK